jgi:hypothetical protein
MPMVVSEPTFPLYAAPPPRAARSRRPRYRFQTARVGKMRMNVVLDANHTAPSSDDQPETR